MAAAELPPMEAIFNKATNPLNTEEDWDSITGFCDQLNSELEGPQIAVRLITHKSQSPQEREALHALLVLESCVKNCGKRFHQEIGKFRFLNELIKIVSPKYLGNHTSEKVKKRVIELMYSWTLGLKHEPKIIEAYSMLKKQGIVKEDPTYMEGTCEPVKLEDEEPRRAVFEDEDKSKLLARLLKSKHPEDLQAANRLIKNMVKQDAERTEKKSRRTLELETVRNNVKLLAEMLMAYEGASASAADRDVMKELFENLEKQRPSLFRLASDTDEKDQEGISEILQVNDSVVKIMGQYKRIIDGVEENGLLDLNGSIDKTGMKKKEDTLDDLFSSPAPNTNTQNPLDLFGLSSSTTAAVPSLPTPPQQTLSSLFSAPAKPLDMPGMLPQNLGLTGTASTLPPMNQSADALLGFDSSQSALQDSSVTSILTPQALSSGSLNTKAAPKETPKLDDIDLLSESLLKQNLPKDAALKHNFSHPTKVSMNEMKEKSISSGADSNVQNPVHVPSEAVSKPTSLLDLANIGQPNQAPTLKSLALAGDDILLPQASDDVLLGLTSSPAGSATNSPSDTASPSKSAAVMSPSIPAVSPSLNPPTKSPILPEAETLADVFVPLESITPGDLEPVLAVDANKMKVIMHFGKDRPRPDVIVIALSITSMNTSMVSNVQFQAAVPKSMKIKLQPQVGKELPGFNPILPPSAITQVMLIANPQKEKVKLKYKLSYKMNGQDEAEVGEVEHFPVR